MSSAPTKQEMGKFASMLADKIRNPLNAIMLHSSLLKRSPGLSTGDRAHLRVIYEETLKVDLFVSKIVEEILRA